MNTQIYDGLCTKLEYQAHLERISDYFLPGEGIWWYEDKDTGNFVFHDGDGEPEFRPEGPQLKSFETETFKSSDWQQCLENNM